MDVSQMHGDLLLITLLLLDEHYFT